MRFLISNLFLFILLSLAGFGYYIGFTESGLRFGVPFIAKSLPGTLTIQEVHGKLFSQFTLKNIIYDTNEQHIEIKSIDIAWNPAGLLKDKLVINNLILENPTIKMNSAPSKTDRFDIHWLKYIVLKQFIVKKLLLQNADAKIEFDGILTDQWNASWRVSIPNINLFLSQSSGSLASTGRIVGPLTTPTINATVAGKNWVLGDKKISTLSGKMDIDLHDHANSTLLLTANNLIVNQTKFNVLELKLDGQVNRENEALIAKLNWTLAKNYYFNAVLSLPKFTAFTDLNQPITGKINLATSSLGFLTQYIPDIKNPTGEVHGTFNINGSLGKPIITGDMDLKNGRVTIPCLGTVLEKINIHILSNDKFFTTYQGSFLAGKGEGHLQGSVDLMLANPTLFVSVKGNNLQIIKLSEYNIKASPDVELYLTQIGLKITGNILIPNAEITLKNFGNTITLPDEIIFIDKTTAQASLPFDTTMKINLILGDHIHFAYKDLDTNLTGKIQLTQNLYGPITATGELRAVKGTYNAYGRVLKIQDGRLIFTGGSLINPGLNIRAVKQVNTILTEGKSNFAASELEAQPIPVYSGTELVTVGVQLSGLLDNFKVSLFSIPGGMSQNDILSYLTLGHPMSRSSKQANGALLNAASALNMGGKSKFNNVTQKLQNKLGLSELDVAPTETFDPVTGKVISTTSVVVGKELTPDLYAHYSKSLFDDAQTLNLRYKLSKRFAIQSETSTISNGADLLYSIERD